MTNPSSTLSVFVAFNKSFTRAQHKQHVGKVAFDECSYYKQKNNWKS